MVDFLRFPVVSLSAEYLVMGYLMRRNILAYKAPPRNEGYDLVCIHPDPRRVTRQIRVQVKSRYQTDSDRAAVVSPSSFSAFDYIVVVFLNIGFFYSDEPAPAGAEAPEFLVLPRRVAKRLHRTAKSGWSRIETMGRKLVRYRGDQGFEQIARDLGVAYPRRG